jgi:ABC-2 type transport system permease protein
VSADALPATTVADAPRPAPRGLALAVAAAVTLWRRDLLRFFRQRSRVVGALAQPLVFWLVIGGGLDKSFAVPGASGLGYREYFYPGVILMVVLFTSIFATMSLIEDRHAGFLQAVLVAPAPRLSIVLGKTLGGTTIALAQAALFLALAPLAGFPYAAVDWPFLVALLLGIALALCALGFFIAWWLDSSQGYHAVMSILLLPMWILSGAMFPAARVPGWMHALMAANPVSYAVEGVRRALYGGHVPAGVAHGAGAAVELAVVWGFAVLSLFAAAAACSRRT